MARSIKIRYAASHYVHGQHDGVRIRIEVVCANEVVSEVFAYRMLPTDPHGNNQGFFSHICSPVDLEDYPAIGPCQGLAPEWFRLSYVDVLVRSVTEAENFLEVVKNDLRRLVDTLCVMDQFLPSGDQLLGCDGFEDCEPVLVSSDSSEPGSSASLASMALVCFTTVGTVELSTGVGVSWTRDSTSDDPAPAPANPCGVVATSSSSVTPGSSSLSSESASINPICVELCTGESSQLLLTHGFDFSSLPDGATITGITSRVTLRTASATLPDSSSISSQSSTCIDPPATLDGCPRLSFIGLQHPEYGLGDNLAANGCIPGPAWVSVVHGGDTCLWGFTGLTTTHIKDGSFGLGLVVYADFSTPTSIVCVAEVELTVCYSV